MSDAFTNNILPPLSLEQPSELFKSVFNHPTEEKREFALSNGLLHPSKSADIFSELELFPGLKKESPGVSRRLLYSGQRDYPSQSPQTHLITPISPKNLFSSGIFNESLVVDIHKKPVEQVAPIQTSLLKMPPTFSLDAGGHNMYGGGVSPVSVPSTTAALTPVTPSTATTSTYYHHHHLTSTTTIAPNAISPESPPQEMEWIHDPLWKQVYMMKPLIAVTQAEQMSLRLAKYMHDLCMLQARIQDLMETNPPEIDDIIEKVFLPSDTLTCQLASIIAMPTHHIAPLSSLLRMTLLAAPQRSAGIPTNVEVPNAIQVDKKTLKRMRNRISAGRCRMKKRIQNSCIEQVLRGIDEMQKGLEVYIAQLEEEKQMLETLLYTPPGYIQQ